jgi:hypothetical protein
VAQAGDESKQSCAVAGFQTMKLSLIVSGYTIRDDPGARAYYTCKPKPRRATLCQHREDPLLSVKSFS